MGEKIDRGTWETVSFSLSEGGDCEVLDANCVSTLRRWYKRGLWRSLVFPLNKPAGMNGRVLAVVEFMDAALL